MSEVRKGDVVEVAQFHYGEGMIWRPALVMDAWPTGIGVELFQGDFGEGGVNCIALPLNGRGRMWP